MTDYSTWSLSKLKTAAANTSPSIVETAANYFQLGVELMDKSQADFMRTINQLQSGWQGKAAQAAIASAQQSYAQMELTRATATDSQSRSTQYASSVDARKQSVAAVPEVDNSWGNAVGSGWWGGAVGVLIAKHNSDQQAKANQQKAAKIVQEMDDSGVQQASTMRSMTWPTYSGAQTPPPSSLPAPPHPSSGGGGAGPAMPSYPSYAPSGNPGGSPTYTPVVMGPQGHGPYNPGTNNGATPGNPPEDTPGPGQSKPPNIPDLPPVQPGDPGSSTTSQGSDGPSVGTPPTVSPAPGGGSSALPSGPGGAAAAGGLLGGAGLLGAIGGRGALAGGAGAVPGEGEPGLRGTGRGSGLGEGEPGVRGGAGPAEGEGAGLRGGLRGGLRSGIDGGSGLAEGDTAGPRAGARASTGLPPEEELAGRGVRGGGIAGEPVAEAGRGGYPMMPGGARRSGADDEEAPMPDYLVETDDVWGDGVSAAPPVIGE